MTIDAPAFFAAHEEAWKLWDVDAICGFFTIPQLLVVRDATHFFETGEALRGHMAMIIARYEDSGVASFNIDTLESEPLPDDAVRTAVQWRLDRADGGTVVRFPLVYTLAWDTEAPDAVPIIMAVNATGEADAWRALRAAAY